MRTLSDVPGPRQAPLIGNLGAILDGPLEFLTDISREHGDLTRFRVGRQDTLVVTSPELIEEVLVKHRKQTVKDPITAGLSDVLGQGLLTAEGEVWKQNRRLIAPSFQPRHLAALGETMLTTTREHAAGWESGVHGVHEHMMELTLDIAVRTLFGTELEGGERVGELVEELMVGFDKKTHTWRRLIPDWVPTPNRRMALRNQRELHSILQTLVDNKRAANDPDASDLLSRLLAARDDDGRGMDDAQLRDEMLTLFLAGHETTAPALSYALMLLAQHPQAQERARAEVPDALSAHHARSLPFVDAVFNEAMRLYPPAWVVGRAAAEPFELDGVHIPTGTVLLLPQWVVHRDARWFADPDAFRPERWLEDEPPHKFAFFPFGGGQRVCVGNHFARMEALLVLAELLEAFELHPVQGFDLDVYPSVTLRPRDGVHIELRRRDGRRSAA